MYTVVLDPKSKNRAQLALLVNFTHPAMLKLVRPLTMLPGTLTYCVPPAMLMACPFLPVTNVGPLTAVAFLPLPLLSLVLPSNLYQTIGGLRFGVGVMVGVGVAVGLPPHSDCTSEALRARL